MKNTVKNIGVNEFIRFGFVGVTATAIHYLVYLLLMKLIWINAAYTIGYVISFVLNFFLTSFFTFKSKPSFKRGIGFGLSHLINYGLHIILLNLFLWLKTPDNYAPIPVFIIVIPINFILVRTVFKSKQFQ